MLNEIRILDFSRVLSGPFCTAMLADVGAEVIKVESPAGDDYRHIAPFRDGESAYFQLVNRNKKSVVLDLKTDFGIHAARTLAQESDVLVENFRPGVADRLGLGYPDLYPLNPRLIYASISGFGQDGPYADRPAYDLIIQAMSGIMEVTGQPDGPPTMIGESVADLVAGVYAAWAITTALYAREKTGRGRQIDVAMLDSLFSLCVSSMVQYLFAGALPVRCGNRHPVTAPFGVFQCADGHVSIAVLNDATFRRFVTAMQRQDLEDDPRFVSDQARGQNESLLRRAIEAWTGRLSVTEVVDMLIAHGVPAGPIWNLEQAVTSDQVEARALLREVDHPTLGGIRLPVQPVQFGDTALPETRPAPGLGQHTEEVLARFGIKTEEPD